MKTAVDTVYHMMDTLGLHLHDMRAGSEQCITKTLPGGLTVWSSDMRQLIGGSNKHL